MRIEDQAQAWQARQGTFELALKRGRFSKAWMTMINQDLIELIESLQLCRAQDEQLLTMREMGSKIVAHQQRTIGPDHSHSIPHRMEVTKMRLERTKEEADA